MQLNHFAMIAAPSARSKAYLQHLCKNNLNINKIYLLSNNPQKWDDEAANYIEPPNQSNTYFELDEPLLYTAKKYGIAVEYITSENINSELSAQKIAKIPEDYLIYSGFGGQILKPHLFTLGKTFIHVHAGRLPQYRGSTTIYYSLLQENRCGASAIILTPGLDEGNVISYKEFPMPPKGINIDYLYEPYIRAEVLLDALMQYVSNGRFLLIPQSNQNAKTYFIIHPVLKHIVLLKQDIQKDGNS